MGPLTAATGMSSYDERLAVKGTHCICTST